MTLPHPAFCILYPECLAIFFLPPPSPIPIAIGTADKYCQLPIARSPRNSRNLLCLVPCALDLC